MLGFRGIKVLDEYQVKSARKVISCISDQRKPSICGDITFLTFIAVFPIITNQNSPCVGFSPSARSVIKRNKLCSRLSSNKFVFKMCDV